MPSIGARSTVLSSSTRARSRRARATSKAVCARSSSLLRGAAARVQLLLARRARAAASAYSASASARLARCSSSSSRAIRSPLRTRWFSSTGISTILPCALLLHRDLATRLDVARGGQHDGRRADLAQRHRHQLDLGRLRSSRCAREAAQRESQHERRPRTASHAPRRRLSARRAHGSCPLDHAQRLEVARELARRRARPEVSLLTRRSLGRGSGRARAARALQRRVSRAWKSGWPVAAASPPSTTSMAPVT